MRTFAPIFIFGLILVSLSDVDARRKRGRLKISSETVGAQVFVNGKSVGKVPLKRSIRLRRGRHTVRLSKLGYADFLESVTIRAGRTTRLDADLIELDGILNADSDPTDADVIVDGRFLEELQFVMSLRRVGILW